MREAEKNCHQMNRIHQHQSAIDISPMIRYDIFPAFKCFVEKTFKCFVGSLVAQMYFLTTS